MEPTHRDLTALAAGMGISLLAFILYHIIDERLNTELRAYRLAQEINDGFDRLEKQMILQRGKVTPSEKDWDRIEPGVDHSEQPA